MFVAKAFLLVVTMTLSGEPRVMGIHPDLEGCQMQHVKEVERLKIVGKDSQFDKWQCQQVVLPTHTPEDVKIPDTVAPKS